MEKLYRKDVVNLIYRVHMFAWDEARDVLEELGLKPDTLIMADAFEEALMLRAMLYSPLDKGREGKRAEVEERVLGWEEAGRPWARWYEFSARRHGSTDIGSGRRIEMKTGAGDWLYSRTSSDLDTILADYSKRTSEVLFSTEYFRIRCSWAELLGYLASYNAKGLYTWFKSTVKYNAMIGESVVQLQTWTNSKKKIAYLQACPWCE